MSQRSGAQERDTPTSPTGDEARARLLAAMPARERRLELAGVSTAVLDGGDGAPLVVLHGGLDAERLLAWLNELIEQIRASPPAVVGHTLGGAIAARYAIGPLRHRPRRTISLLVLVDALGLDSFRPNPRFALAMVGFLARPTEHTRDRFLGQCT